MWRVGVVLDIVQHHHRQAGAGLQGAHQLVLLVRLAHEELDVSSELNDLRAPGSPDTAGSGEEITPGRHHSHKHRQAGAGGALAGVESLGDVRCEGREVRRLESWQEETHSEAAHQLHQSPHLGFSHLAQSVVS